MVFLVAGFIYLIGAVVFCVFGSADEQEWARPNALDAINDDRGEEEEEQHCLAAIPTKSNNE